MSGSKPSDEEHDKIDEGEEQDKIDTGVEDTFPASDPPATGGSTGPNDALPPGRG